jgi:hypothetical protein
MQSGLIETIQNFANIPDLEVLDFTDNKLKSNIPNTIAVLENLFFMFATPTNSTILQFFQ